MYKNHNIREYACQGPEDMVKSASGPEEMLSAVIDFLRATDGDGLILKSDHLELILRERVGLC